MRAFVKKYSHAWVLVYFIFYMQWFTWLERTVTTKYTVIHLRLDDKIPFCEWFAIPYFLWFAYIFVSVAYFFFKDRGEFYRNVAFLFIGMTICLTIYTIWPNGHDLRPDLDTLGRSNIFTRLIGWLYGTDTCTNVCPSIHAFNSIGACIAVYKSRHLKEKHILRTATLVLTVLICMSTVFLKQHSIFDVICACILSIVMYALVYVPDYAGMYAKRRARRADTETVH